MRGEREFLRGKKTGRLERLKGLISLKNLFKVVIGVLAKLGVSRVKRRGGRDLHGVISSAGPNQISNISYLRTTRS